MKNLSLYLVSYFFPVGGVVACGRLGGLKSDEYTRRPQAAQHPQFSTANHQSSCADDCPVYSPTVLIAAGCNTRSPPRQQLHLSSAPQSLRLSNCNITRRSTVSSASPYLCSRRFTSSTSVTTTRRRTMMMMAPSVWLSALCLLAASNFGKMRPCIFLF